MPNGIPKDHSMLLLCLSDHSASQIDLANFRFQSFRFSETHLTDKNQEYKSYVVYSTDFYRFFMYLLNLDTWRVGGGKAGENKGIE